MEPIQINRCPWCESTPDYMAYHDKEWGVPNHNDKLHFEFLILEAAQAGLSWLTILRKREGYRKAFAQFDPIAVSKFTEDDIERLMVNPMIVRNRLKIKAAINSAKLFLNIVEEFGSFDTYVWRFVGNEIKQNKFTSLSQIPVTTFESDALAIDLKKRGFKFLGSTTMYAYMQAMGLVNDHLTSCFRFDKV